MAERIQIDLLIPGLPPSNTSATRRHWRSQYADARRWHENTSATLACRYGRIIRDYGPLGRARLTAVRWSSTMADLDNIATSFKAVRDALKASGVVVDDSPAWLEGDYGWGYATRNSGCVSLVVSGERRERYVCQSCGSRYQAAPHFCPSCRTGMGHIAWSLREIDDDGDRFLATTTAPQLGRDRR